MPRGHPDAPPDGGRSAAVRVNSQSCLRRSASAPNSSVETRPRRGKGCAKPSPQARGSAPRPGHGPDTPIISDERPLDVEFPPPPAPRPLLSVFELQTLNFVPRPVPIRYSRFALRVSPSVIRAFQFDLRYSLFSIRPSRPPFRIPHSPFRIRLPRPAPPFFELRTSNFVSLLRL